MPELTIERVGAAYAALASGDSGEIDRYWDESMRWCVPGQHEMAGWYESRDEFLGFMATVAKRSADSFVMTPITVLVNDQYSADVTRNVGYRGGDTAAVSPYEALDIDVVHLLRWRDGRVVEGRGAIFGDGTTNFDQFWSQLDAAGRRVSD